MMLLNRLQVNAIYLIVLDKGAEEVILGGEEGNLLVSLVDEDGDIFYRFDLNEQGEISQERKL